MKKQLIALTIAALAGLPALAQTTVTAEQYFANAQQLAAQAEIAYPQPFLDVTKDVSTDITNSILNKPEILRYLRK